MMKKDEAKKWILQEWQKWLSDEKYNTTLFCAKFYLYLRKEKPELLSYTTHSSDKQTEICGWVSGWQSQYPKDLD